MKNTWLKRLNRALKKKTPLLGFTVLQLLVLWVVISGGVAAIVVARHQSPETVHDTRAKNTGDLNPYNKTSEEAAVEKDQTSNQQTTQQTNNTSAPSKCNRVDIPYRTSYENSDKIPVGQRQESGGQNGFYYICNGVKGTEVKPNDKIVWLGAYESPPPPSVPVLQPTPRPPTNSAGMTYLQVFDYCHGQLMNGSISGQNGFNACMQQRGF